MKLIYLLSVMLFLNNPSLVARKSECPNAYPRNIVHYADEHDPHNRLLTLNYKTMQLLDTHDVPGSLNHHADVMGEVRTANYLLMIPKGSRFVTVRELKSGEFVKKIRLPFQPRSADAYNKKNHLLLLTSRNRPAGVLLDTVSLKIVGKAGFNIQCNQPPIEVWNNRKVNNRRGCFIGFFFGWCNNQGDENPPIPSNTYSKEDIPNLNCNVNDFGGDQVSGHPIWLNSRTFSILDRANRLLHLYRISKSGNQWKTSLTQTIKTDTSLHQIVPRFPKRAYNRIFYGMTESTSNANKVSGVYKFRLNGSRLRTQKFVKLKYRDILGINGHNLYITPDGRYIYAPVGATIIDGKQSEGGIFILDANSMRIMKFIKTGYGAGHVAFAQKRGLAIVTNHKSKFLSVINYRWHRFVKNVPLNFKSENIFSLYQSHSQYIDRENDYYYNFWTDGGVFFRLNLISLQIDKSVYVGGVPIQGNFYPSIASNCNPIRPAVEDGYDEIFAHFNDPIVVPQFEAKDNRVPKARAILPNQAEANAPVQQAQPKPNPKTSNGYDGWSKDKNTNIK